MEDTIHEHNDRNVHQVEMLLMWMLSMVESELSEPDPAQLELEFEDDDANIGAVLDINPDLLETENDE